MRFDFRVLRVLWRLDLAAIGIFLSVGWSALAAPPSWADRYPVAVAFETIETTTSTDGASTTTRSRTTCARNGGVERCVVVDVDGKIPLQSSESAYDSRGIWSMWTATEGGMKVTFEPAVLTLPSDARPGSRWRAEFEETMTSPDTAPVKRRSIRESVVEVTDRCPKARAGLLVKTTKTTEGALRMKSESLYCRGFPAPMAVNVELYRDGKRTVTISSKPKAP